MSSALCADLRDVRYVGAQAVKEIGHRFGKEQEITETMYTYCNLVVACKRHRYAGTLAIVMISRMNSIGENKN